MGKSSKRGGDKAHNKRVQVRNEKLIQERKKMNKVYTEMMEQKLNGMLNNNGSGVTIEQSLIHISKWLGQWINPKNITTKEYFDLQKEMDRYNKMNDGKKN